MIRRLLSATKCTVRVKEAVKPYIESPHPSLAPIDTCATAPPHTQTGQGQLVKVPHSWIDHTMSYQLPSRGERFTGVDR